jgi:hypothetical protein
VEDVVYQIERAFECVHNLNEEEGRACRMIRDLRQCKRSDPEPMDALQPNARADGPILEVPAGVFEQRDNRLRNAACPDRGMPRNQAREAGGLPVATPSADCLPIPGQTAWPSP